MRTALLLSLCCLVITLAAFSAFAQDEDSAARTVRQFVKALTSGDLERAASLLTQDSVLFISSATSIVPPESMKEKPAPAFFDQQLTNAEAQALRGVVDAIILSNAVKIDPGKPVTTAAGVKVPVTVVLRRDIFVSKEGDAILVDLAAPYPEARATIRGMTAEGEPTTPEETTPEQQPGEAPPAPGEAPGTGGAAPGDAGEPSGTTGAPSGAAGPAAVVNGGSSATAAEVEAARRAACLSNLKQLTLAMLMYARP